MTHTANTPPDPMRRVEEAMREIAPTRWKGPHRFVMHTDVDDAGHTTISGITEVYRAPDTAADQVAALAPFYASAVQDVLGLEPEHPEAQRMVAMAANRLVEYHAEYGSDGLFAATDSELEVDFDEEISDAIQYRSEQHRRAALGIRIDERAPNPCPCGEGAKGDGHVCAVKSAPIINGIGLGAQVRLIEGGLARIGRVISVARHRHEPDVIRVSNHGWTVKLNIADEGTTWERYR